MSQNLNTINEFISSTYNGLLANFNGQQEVLVHFNEELTQENISRLETEIEQKITESAIAKVPLKKIFFISVETLQNMFIHGSLSPEGKKENFFILTKTSEKVQVTSANLIPTPVIEELQTQLTKINSFEDAAELKKFYLEHLDKNELSDKGGAGLGFITIAMKSGNKLTPAFHPIDASFSLFILTATVNLD